MNPDVSPGSVTYRLSGPWASSVSFQSLRSLICKMLSASYDCNVHRYLALKHLAISMLPINVSDYYMYWHPWKELEVICNETQIYNKKKRINIRQRKKELYRQNSKKLVSASKGKAKWVKLFGPLSLSKARCVSQPLLTIVSPTPAQQLQLHGASLLTPLDIKRPIDHPGSKWQHQNVILLFLRKFESCKVVKLYLPHTLWGK